MISYILFVVAREDYLREGFPCPMILFLNYNGTPISRTLEFSKTPLTRTKSCFSWTCFNVILPPIFRSSRFLEPFPWMFEESKFHCTLIVELTNQVALLKWLSYGLKVKNRFQNNVIGKEPFIWAEVRD